MDVYISSYRLWETSCVKSMLLDVSVYHNNAKNKFWVTKGKINNWSVISVFEKNMGWYTYDIHVEEGWMLSDVGGWGW